MSELGHKDWIGKAAAIRFRDNVDAGSGASRANYSISNLEKKHMGFRVRADIHRSIFSVRFEMGMRPGVNYFPGGELISTDRSRSMIPAKL